MTEKQKILLIEDEPAIAENIIFALEAEHYEVHHALTGTEGLSLFNQKSISFIILDLNLPDKAGFDICREIRQKSNVPILILSARRDEIDRIVGLELGADDYLMKPFSLRELSARIRVILRRTNVHVQPDQSTELIPGKENGEKNFPLRVDLARNCIWFFDQKLDLSKNEFLILKTLASKPGWVFSRDQLLDISSGQQSAVFDRTIDAHIKSIRAKLRLVYPDRDVIETQRGFGYSLRENW